MAGTDVFPIPFRKFAPELHGTPDHVWARLLKIRHGRENHTPDEWRAIIESYRHRPAHPSHRPA